MAAYSMDLRTRVLADWDTGMKAHDVAAKYRVSRAWVHRLVQRRREHGEIAPRPRQNFAPARSLPSRRNASAGWSSRSRIARWRNCARRCPPPPVSPRFGARSSACS
jgi:transposase